MEESNAGAIYWPGQASASSPVVAGAAGLTEQDMQEASAAVGLAMPERQVVVMQRTRRQFGRRVARWLGVAMVLGFAGVGLVFTSVFVAMQFGLLNVRGSSQERNEFFASLPKADISAAVVPKKATTTSCVEQGADGQAVAVCTWNKSAEWATVRGGLLKDQAVILDVSQKTGVPARMIAASVAPEQLRFFTSDREAYKRYFEPMKTLGSLTQFSLGIAGFKEQTARQVEQYTTDKNSPFYAGDGMAALVAYPADANHDSTLYNRLTDAKNHYYSYLYAALFIKEIQAQWASEGYDISDRPDVLTTLFNIGFGASHPKANPQIGGTPITLNGQRYSYGELGTAFYRSDEMTAIFPRP